MQTLPWDRSAVIDGIRQRIWLYLSPASEPTNAALEASVLLELGDRDALALARALFLVSDEVGAFLSDVPSLLRRLPTSSAVVEERSMERVRGPVRWQPTLLERRATGVRNLYITAPAERAFQTPENHLLFFLLTEISTMGQQLGWSATTTKGTAGPLVSARVHEATRLLSSRMLATVDGHRPSLRHIARVRTGRHRRRFATALAAHDLYDSLVSHLDGPTLKQAVEHRGLIVQANDRLFEIWCFFLVLDSLKADGWQLPPPVVFPGGLVVKATRGMWRLNVHYQRLPRFLRAESRYRLLLKAHGVGTTGLQPDVILVASAAGSMPRVLLVELKMGTSRGADESIREALQNLLAYEASFAFAMADQIGTAGLGVAWGAKLVPADERIMLASVDHLAEGVSRFTASLNG